MRASNTTPNPRQAALVFGLTGAVTAAIILMTRGDPAGLIAALAAVSGLGAWVTALLCWRLVSKRAGGPTRLSGFVAGLLVGVLSHLPAMMGFAAVLGGPAEALKGVVLSLFSVITFGWLTGLVGGAVGALLVRP